MSIYLGDFAAGATIRFGFNTTAIAGESITLATDGTISVYKNGDASTEVTTGVTFTENFDSKTGAHLVTIVTSDAFYAAAADYMVMLAGATIDGKAINAWIATFSIQNRYASAAPGAATIAAAVWDRLTSALTTSGSIGALIVAKLGLITAGNVTFTSPVDPNTNDLTLYNQDYTAASGITQPAWEQDDWEDYGLLAALSLTLYYRTKDGSADVAFGTLTALTNKKVQLEIEKTAVQALPYGMKAAGIKIVAVLDVAHGSDTVELVNAGLNHINYRKNVGE